MGFVSASTRVYDNTMGMRDEDPPVPTPSNSTNTNNANNGTGNTSNGANDAASGANDATSLASSMVIIVPTSDSGQAAAEEETNDEDGGETDQQQPVEATESCSNEEEGDDPAWKQANLRQLQELDKGTSHSRLSDALTTSAPNSKHGLRRISARHLSTSNHQHRDEIWKDEAQFQAGPKAKRGLSRRSQHVRETAGTTTPDETFGTNVELDIMRMPAVAQVQAQPGAVAMPPSSSHRRRIADLEQGELDAIDLVNDGLHVSEDLVEATALGISREFLVSAQQVPSAELRRQSTFRAQIQNSKNSAKWPWCFLLALTMIALAIGLAVGLGTRRNEGQLEEASVAPTLSPSAAPSSAPTEALDLLLSNLPDYTLESLQVFGTPQWQARDWLANHPDINVMEEWRKLQLFVLATFFYAFEGPNWRQEVRDDWLRYDLSECDWWSAKFGHFDQYGNWQPVMEEGDPCEESGTFRTLSLKNVQLSSNHKPVIPPQLGLLTSLVALYLEGNSDISPTSLSSWLPSQFYQLTNLQYWSFRNNALYGTLPTQLGLLANLHHLLLVKSDLTGTIPSEIGSIPELRWFELQSNQLTGTIPSQLGKLKGMNYLGLWSNALSGNVPKELFAMTDAKRFFLDDNLLTGTIATEFGLLSGVQRLGLQQNLFSGWIPSELGLLTRLHFLATTANPLSGTVPTQMGRLSAAEALDFGFGLLTGRLPSQLGMLNRLLGMSIEQNALSGSIPSELLSLTGLHALSLRETALTGHIPTEFGSMYSLEGLYLGGTPLSGSIPTQLGLLDKLSVLDLSNMPLLTGAIPEEVNMLESFQVLRLDGSNELSGTISDGLCALGTSSCNLGYWWLEFRMDTKECVLEFDCTERLCGCDCPCANSTI